MLFTNSNDAQILRRAALGPHALMQRQAVHAFVPDRGAAFVTPSRSKPRMFMGLAGSTGTAAAKGAATGASLGSAVPIVGTAIGAILGGVAGAIASAFSRQDQEVQNFDQASAMARQNLQSVLNISNKYLVLAGLFDLSPSQIKGNIPIYKKYGRMGEGRFVHDMCTVVYQAAQSGQINANDTPQSVFAKIVQPWINSFGFGAMSDSNGEMINLILVGMIAEYCADLQTTRWFSRGGDNGFGDLPKFSFPGAAQPVQPGVTGSATPSPVAVQTNTQAELSRYQSGSVPARGNVIHFAKGPDGQFLALPVDAAFYQVDPATGAWVITYQGSMYALSGGALVPWSPQIQGAANLPQVASSNDTAATVAAALQQTAQAVPQYVSSGGGGGGGYYSAPAAYSPSVASAPAAGGIPWNEVAMIGGGVAVLFLLLRQPRKLA